MDTKISFDLIFEPEKEGGYTVTVPAIPECVTYGASFEEASGNAREAILLCLEDRHENGQALPEEAPRAVLSSIEFSRRELLTHA